ncbi:M48 family metalloprotease [Candidatus Saccharibacteria bacterium]|nr:M48 family metalloprotease [Candidatus Saccharibacteria bacterium]
MYKNIAANKRNTVFLMIGFVVLIVAIGILLAFINGEFNHYTMLGFSVFAIIYVVVQYFAASKIAVAMTGAKKIEKKDNRRLYNIVENLSLTAGLPMPEVYIINDPAPNAFASGRDPKHSLVAATTGLLDIMDDKELTAVMAHELSHVKNYDIRLTTMVFGLVSLIGFIADIGWRIALRGRRRSSNDDVSPVAIILVLITSIIAPFVAVLAQMAVSREREYLADASAAHLTRYPEGMIAALRKLESHAQPMQQQNPATEAMFISSPLRKKSFNNLFSTHPPIEKRIERLENGKHKF